MRVYRQCWFCPFHRREFSDTGCSPVVAVGGSNTATGGGGAAPCCHMARWRWDINNNNNNNCFLSSTFVFFIGAFVMYGFIGAVYAWLFINPHASLGLASSGCLPDSEGSWAIGVFYGHSPFSLRPIEAMNVWRNESAAWPVANPVVTCASASEADFPSNFVADPFLYVQGDTLFLFYETKNSITAQGDIGVSKSDDNGATWQHLGIALDEEWHLSYPYVFEYLGETYMMPESSAIGEVRIYRALNFPLQWKLEKVILKKHLVDSVLINHDGKYWIFGSDHTGFGAKKNGQMEIWYSGSPFGPWKPHRRNPIYNADKSFGARNGGRPFVYKGNLYRMGQDCGETYGRRVRAFKVEVLTKNDFKEVEVSLGIEKSNKGRNAWNGARHHHLDVQQLSSGHWIGVMDGDRVPSGDSARRFILGYASAMASFALVMLLGALFGAVKCIIPLNWCPHNPVKRSDAFLTWEQSNLMSSKLRQFCSRLNRAPLFLRGMIKPNTATGRLVIFVIFMVGAVQACIAVKYIFGGNGAEEAYPLKGSYSQFTLLTMTYEARLWNLKMYVKHYSRCPSVGEIVIVWNKGEAPQPSDLDSAVPVRIRTEEKNSLNNRFKIDPQIKNRGVLELDDDIMMSCEDIERGFRVWREHPERIVGFYPRLVEGSILKYDGEKYARKLKGYNMILTGAAFIDGEVAFERYWSDGAAAGRKVVDEYFNCEDVLMNYLYANASSTWRRRRRRSVEYVRPSWVIDTSKLSGVAISGNTQHHYSIRSKCLLRFSDMYGGLGKQKWEFDRREDGWDL